MAPEVSAPGESGASKEAAAAASGPRPRASSPVALATTALGTGEDGPAPPRIVREDEEDEGPDPMIGQVLSGLYKVEGQIGEGGMGRVYMAVHIHLDKPFAVKVLSERVAANKTAVDRLLQEAKAASSIDHDNIVDVVSFDATDEGRVFLVMEMLEGVSLADLVDQGPMRLERALPIAYQVCQALEAAHQRGIIHRDLKPENVFICRKQDADFVKILDFGISKVKTAETEQVRMTRTGQLVGTPLYMSPEQARGETDIDHRADIYALGVMLYEMICGRPPFEGGNYFQLLWKHGNETPQPPSVHVDGVPEGVEAALMKALAKDPADRPQSMAELEAMLVAAAPEIGVAPSRLVSLPPVRPAELARPAAEVSAPPTKRSPLLYLAAAALLLGAGFVAAMLMREPPPPPAAATAPSAPEEPGEPAEEAPDAPAEPAEVAAEAVEPAALPMGEAPPTSVRMRFTSTPEGAEVLLGDTVLGTTPFEAEVPRDAASVRYRLARHRGEEVALTPEEGGVVTARLRRRRAPASMQSSLPSIRMDL